MAGNVFNAALTGMNAAQYGMTTTQHNIANAATPGYTRQQVMLSSSVGSASGSGFVGQGVNVAGVRRIYDQFLTGQVMQQQSQTSNLNTYLASMTQMDNQVSNAGISASMQSLFTATNALANSPADIPSRQTVLSTAQSAVNGFQALNQSLTDISNGLTGQISSSVQTVNTYATQIASLNTTIQSATASGLGQLPNDLLDQRDQLINLLNKEVKVSVLPQNDGTMSVFIGSGQPLVVGNQAMALQVVQNQSDPSKVDVAYVTNGRISPMQQSSLTGGNLGAYMTFRDQNLQPALNALGLVALGLATKINQQNSLGQDLNGAPGGSLMNAAPPLVNIGPANTGIASVTASIADVSAVTASNYQLKFDGTNYSLTRQSDNTVTQLGSVIPPAGLTRVVDGVALTVSTGMVAGDSFLIRPTANAARDIALMTSDPTKIAAALPFRGTAAISATNFANITTVASGLISGSVVSGTTTTAAVGNFTVDGKTLFTNTIAAGATGTLITGAQLDVAWPAFAAANPSYTLTGTFGPPGNNAQITKSGGAQIVLAEVNSGGAGGAITAFAAANPLFMGTTLGNAASKIASVNVVTPGNANLANPVAITFTNATTYTVTGAVPAPVPNPVIGYAGGPISYNGWTMQLTTGASAPAAGDVFNVGANSGTATVSSGAYNLNPVSVNFTSATAYNVVEMRGTPPAAVTLGTGLIPPAGGGSSTVSYNGWTTQITGIPVAGDVFNVAKGSQVGTMLATPAATNIGAGAISGGTLNVQPFTIIFNKAVLPATGFTYTVSGATPAPLTNPVTYVTGQDISYNGWTMQVSGTPGVGDVFNVAPNTTGTGDSRNALLMAGLQNQNLLSNGTTSFQGSYSQLLGAIGAKTSELTVTSTAQNTMLSQTVAAQQSVSGVNLDEEAANLLQYQRAYQASAKAMQVANTMFDALLTLR